MGFRLGNIDPSLSRDQQELAIKPKLFFVVEGAETERIYVQAFKNLFADRILGEVICLDRIDRTKSHQLYIVTLIDEYFKSLSSLDPSTIQNIKLLRNDILRDNQICDDFLQQKLNEIRELIGSEVFEKLFGKLNLEVPSDPLQTLNAFVELQNFSKDFDQILILIDRDGQSFKPWQYDKVLSISEEQGYKLGITNPCFEFFLFLHLSSINKADKKKLKQNDKHSIHCLKKELKKYSKSFSKNDYDANFIVSKFHDLENNIKLSKIVTDPKSLKNKMGTSVYEIIKQYL